MVNAASPTAMAPTQANGQKAPARSMWGSRGVTERFYVLDSAIQATSVQNTTTFQEAGILSEIQLHLFGSLTSTGAMSKDTFGPYSIYNTVGFKASGNTLIVSLSHKGLNIMNIMEYPGMSWEAADVPVSVQDPLTNSTDYFSYPSLVGSGSANIRFWTRIPLALKLFGVPGGSVGYVVLQNKRIGNFIQQSFNATGPSTNSVFSSTVNGGNAAYFGANSVTGSPTVEIWKTLNTVPTSPSNMPLMGYTRYWQEYIQPYSGSSFTYNFEPGGDLLSAAFWFVDAQAGAGSTPAGMATSNLSQIAYQYGTNKQMDVYSPYRQIHQQMQDYYRPLPQGCFVFDYYTPWRTLANVKSTENTANPQVQAILTPGYSVPSNSQVYVILDKLFGIQNYVVP